MPIPTTIPAIADVTADFVYARLQRSSLAEEAGYSPAALDDWARRARIWSEGGAPPDLATVAEKEPAKKAPRPVFLFFIAGDKEKAPAAAIALIARLAKA